MQKKIFSQSIVYSVVCLTMLSGGKSYQSLLTPKQSMPTPTIQQKPFATGQPIRISPPPTMAPKPIVTPPATPPATSLITPIVPQQVMVTQPMVQPMTPVVQPTITPVPVAPPEDRTKLVAQQKFYNEISDKTTSDDLKKNVAELIKDIINPVTMKTIFSVSFIEDVKALIDLALKQLDIIFIQAKTSANTEKQTVITTLTTQLKVAQDDISQYLQKIKAFSMQLQATKTITSTQINEITVSFTNVTQQISGLLPNEVIQSYITGIDDLVKNAKANGQSNASAFKMLFDAVSKQQFLSIAAKQQILALLENRLRTLPRLFSILTAQGAAATIRPEIQVKIQEAATKATLSDKIRYLRIIIPLINALALQGEKNAFLSILNEILVSLQTLKKTDINELTALFSDLLNNKFIINSQQRYESGEPWQKILMMAIDIMDESNMLLASIKQRIKIENNNFDMTMKACFCGLSILLARPTDQEERKKDNKESLVWLLRHYIPLLYPNRAGKTQEQLYNLQLLFSLAKTIPEISDVINPVGQQAISVILALAIAKEITNTIAKIKAYQDISEILSHETKFESKEYGTDLSNIFTNRDKRAIKELDFFSTLLNELTSPAMQGKKAFEESDYKRFNEWKNILPATIKLMRDIPYIQDPLEMINALDGIIPNIANQTATFEKESAAPLFTMLFSKRGDYKHQTLVNFSLFLEKAGKTQSFLAPNQIAVIFTPSTTSGKTDRGPWLKDLDVGINYTKGTNDTYATAVLRKAVEKKSTALLWKAITLFTPKTAQETKTLLAQSLQTFFDARNTLDKNSLKDCFSALSKNKALPGIVGKDFMLDNAQQAVLDAWIDIIVKELAQAPTSAPVPQAPVA